MGQSKEIKLNLTEPRNFGIFFCVVFSYYDQRFICEKEDWASTNFEALLIFPGFLRSYNLSRLSIREVICIQSLQCYISSIALVVANKNNTEMWQCFIILILQNSFSNCIIALLIRNMLLASGLKISYYKHFLN